MAAKKNGNEPNAPAGREYVFRTHDGREVGRAKNVAEFVAVLKVAPLDSVLYHANGSHFSPWLAMMGKSVIAGKARAIKGSNESVRRALLALFV